MKIVEVIYPFFYRNNKWEYIGFKPLLNSENIAGADVLLIDGERYGYDPNQPKNDDSEHFFSFDKENLTEWLRGIGSSDRPNDLLLLENKLKYRIYVGEDIILFTDGWRQKEELELFTKVKRKKNYHLHLIIKTKVDYKSCDYHEMLRLYDLNKEINSICFLNQTEYYQDKCSDEEKAFGEELIFEEMEYAVRAISNEHFQDFRIYNHLKKCYVPCSYPLEKNGSLFLHTAPSKNKELCDILYQYRHDFANKHSLDFNDAPCTNCFTRNLCNGECKDCMYKTEKLWMKNQENEYGTYNRQKWPYPYNNVSAKINGLDRMRIDIDGNGVRTLILLAGCPLNCKYCGNKQFKDIFPTTTSFSVNEIGNTLHQDGIYFEMSGGGLTFGGGEPLLQADFIHEIHRKYPMWSINIETSLYCDPAEILKLTDDIDHWFVDIKDMNPEIYKRYTGGDIWTMLENLQVLIKNVSVEKITVRVPRIKQYNTEDDIQESVHKLEDMGFINIDVFDYSMI